MSPTDPKTPGTYYLTAVIGFPEICGDTFKMTLHGDGHLEHHWAEGPSHLHQDATEALWHRLSPTYDGAKEIARAIKAKGTP